MRLFISVDLPDALTDAVARVQSRFADAPGIRSTDPTQAHITLKFLGDVPRSDLPMIIDIVTDAVDAVGVAPFPITVAGLGVFPSLEYISVVWLGVEDGTEQLTKLHKAIEQRAVAAGFDPADNEFTPHITICRMDHAGGKSLVQEQVRTGDPTVGHFTAQEVRITESVLTDDGPEYSTVEAIEL